MSERDKLFICMDVDLPRHDKIVLDEEPLAILGLWAALTAYSRELLTDGRVPKKLAETMCGERNGKRLSRMVESGLLSETPTHYVVEKYAPRNQTKAMVEAARAVARDRQALSRRKKAEVTSESQPSSRVTSRVTDGVTHNDLSSVSDVTLTPTRARAPDCSSLSGSSSSSEGVQGGPPRPDVVTLDEPMPAGALARVETIAMNRGWRPADVDSEWLKYLGKTATRRPRSELEPGWQAWLVDAERYAKRDAQRDAARATPRAFPPRQKTPVNAPWLPKD